MPSSGNTSRDARHESLLIICGEECRELQDTLPEDHVQRLCQAEVLHRQFLPEYPVHLAMRVEHSHVALAYNDKPIVVILGIAHHRMNLFGSNLPAPDHLVANEAQCAIDGHIPINQVLDVSEIGDDQRWSPRGDEHLMAIGLGLGQSQNRRGRNLVGIETHQRPVNIEKQGIFSHTHFLCFAFAQLQEFRSSGVAGVQTIARIHQNGLIGCCYRVLKVI